MGSCSCASVRSAFRVGHAHLSAASTAVVAATAATADDNDGDIELFFLGVPC